MSWGYIVGALIIFVSMLAGFGIGRSGFLSKEIDRIDRNVGWLNDTRHEIQQIYAYIEKRDKSEKKETTWLERLETEEAELRARVKKLDRQLSAAAGVDMTKYGITEHEMLLLKLQHSSMRAYLEIVDERLRIGKAKAKEQK